MCEVNDKQPMLIHLHSEIEIAFLIGTKQRHVPWLHFYPLKTVNNFGYVWLTYSLKVHGICRRIFSAVVCLLWIEVGFAVILPE